MTAFVQAIAPTVLIGAAISCCGALIALFFIPRRINRQISADELEPVSETTAVSPEKEIQKA